MTITLRDLAPGDLGWITMRHGELYTKDEGFDASFEPLVAQILVDYVAKRDPAKERAWVAVDDRDQRLGSIFCVHLNDQTAKLRLFLVEPAARGQGLGQRLLTACTDWARARGYTRMTLWTHESHRAACALYAAHGFTCTDQKSVHSFGQDLVEQSWEIAL